MRKISGPVLIRFFFSLIPLFFGFLLTKVPRHMQKSAASTKTRMKILQLFQLGAIATIRRIDDLMRNLEYFLLGVLSLPDTSHNCHHSNKNQRFKHIELSL